MFLITKTLMLIYAIGIENWKEGFHPCFNYYTLNFSLPKDSMAANLKNPGHDRLKLRPPSFILVHNLESFLYVFWLPHVLLHELVFFNETLS